MSAPSADDATTLTALAPGQEIVYGGNRVAVVSSTLADVFGAGDRIVVDPGTGEVLHIPSSEHVHVGTRVGTAVTAFAELAMCSDEAISAFFHEFADRLADDASFGAIAAANAEDVRAATERGRSTTRLELTDSMRRDMIAGLQGWAAVPAGRDVREREIRHDGWAVESRRAPLGVVGFVFEGRPNVFADAAGVVRTGNTVVFRIGSDALGSARAIMEHALEPALAVAGLPSGTVGLIDSAAHAAGWALFSDARLSLAVARGSGFAVAQLGAVARQAGVPVSLHGTGGAWMVAAPDADTGRFGAAVMHSLDRKVCNTLNVCCITESRAAELVPVFLAAVRDAAKLRSAHDGHVYDGRVHATHEAMRWIDDADRGRHSTVGRADGVHDELFVSEVAVNDLAHEWEWESSPEVSLHVVDSVDEAVALCNRLSPRFVASLISESPAAHDAFFTTVDAPFVADGFTRWVDGQYALDAPELGLSNWEGGRMLARGGILSGDSVYTIRYRARIGDPHLHR